MPRKVVVTGALTEKQFMQQVQAAAKMMGYYVYHPWLSIRSERGWPDLAIWRDGVFLLAELKTDKGRLTPSQSQTIMSLRRTGLHVYVWRPRDWDDILKVLANPPRIVAETHDACAGCSPEIL